MRFPPGRPILAMLVVAALTGAGVALRPSPPRSDLDVWTFAAPHRDAYLAVAPDFERQSGRTVGIDLMSTAALNVRLSSIFMSPRTAREAPDAVEVEINSMARYLRPPVEDVGFVPLNHYLDTTGFRTIPSLDAPGRRGWNARLPGGTLVYTFDGSRWVPNPSRARPDAWIDRIVPNRLVPWSKEGRIFGVPHDVHPITITYRADLFEEAGVRLEEARTWDEFRDACVTFERYWAARGVRGRHAMELSRSNCEHLAQMLLQRHINLVDEHDRVRLNDPRVTDTLVFYAGLVAGPGRVGVPSSSGGELWARDLADGNVCAALTPDWKVRTLRQYASDAAGRFRMMPLPRFEPSDARTSTWGGTMIGIPRTCPHPDEAWKLIETLYFSPEGLDARYRSAEILPPIPEEWDKPIYHQPDPLFGGQEVMALYARLAEEIPPNHVGPASLLALAELSYVLGRVVRHVDAYGTGDVRAFAGGLLGEAADDIAARLRQGAFAAGDPR